ncbi:hypothetical protein GC209_02705 [bacterium]|nr:hypothetical protein [bacterium]
MPKMQNQIPELPRLTEAEPEATPRHAGGLVWAAAGFSLVWVAGVGLYVWSGLSPKGLMGMAMTALVVVLPLGLAWGVATTLTSIRGLRAEAARLQATVDSLRTAPPASQLRASAQGERRGAEPAGSFTSRRDSALTVPSADRRTALAAPRAAPLAEEQPGLALGTPTDEPGAPLSMADFVRAIHFPEDPDDTEGFRALRLALADRSSAKLIRASQDVLTLLAQEGIYMDELSPDRARPELWRKFAAGERGRAIAGLGGIRDRSCLALTASRMREDTVFRDAAHHFLRSFDKAIAAIEPQASDSELSALSDTRTARAFMLFGRVTGTFD